MSDRGGFTPDLPRGGLAVAAMPSALTSNGAYNISPAISPDDSAAGLHLARGGAFKLHVM